MEPLKYPPRRRARRLAALALAAVLALFAWSLRNPVRTLLSLRRPDPDAACWTLDVHGDYRLDRVLARGARNERELLEAVRAEFAPLLSRAALPPLPDFGCSTFVARTPDGHALFGRNFDLEPRTPPLVVRTRPRGGYASVSTTGLLFLGFPDGAVPSPLPRRLALLAAPFVPVDGVNEKGLAAAVLMLPGERPPEPDTGRTPIQTTLAVRLVLDRAATVDEALALLGRYEMHHAIGSAFHVHLSDATGASAVVEWDGPGGAPRAVRPAAPVSAPAAPAVRPAPRPDFYRSMSAETFRARGYAVAPAPKAKTEAQETVLRSCDMPYQTRLDLPRSAPAVPARPQTPENTGLRGFSTGKIVENPVQNVEKPTLPDHKIVGEALRLYIIVELDGELLLIDKHAAHERMIFDRLKSQDRAIMAQTLLESVTLRLTEEDKELLEANAELLNELGFEIEPFGESDYILRAVPADMESSDAAAAVEEILEKLRGGKAPDPKSARDEILHTVACKAAIKAGWDTDRVELQRIVDAVLSGQVKYCPHGRPVSVTVTRRDLDKLFKRIV